MKKSDYSKKKRIFYGLCIVLFCIILLCIYLNYSYKPVIVNSGAFSLKKRFTEHSDNIWKVQFSPDGKALASCSIDSTVIIREKEKDEQLLELFDRISHYSDQLFYGRYDIKCASIADLKKGLHFSILEFNGTGAEPHHVYGNGNHFIQAYILLAQHWKVLFTIARYHYKRGVKYKTLIEGLRFTRKANAYFKHLRSLDKQMPVFH